MPYEMIVTNANTLAETVIGFGNKQEVAQNVFQWTWRGLISDGYVSLHNIQNPQFIEIKQRGGPSALFMELRYTPEYDFANALRLINMLALEKLYPNHFHSGLLMADTVRSEQALKNLRYKADVTSPDGRCMSYPLPVERDKAIKRFNDLVREREASGWLVMRCPDADLKWKALDTNGAVTIEFIEVQA